MQVPDTFRVIHALPASVAALAALVLVATIPGVVAGKATTKIVSVRSNGASGKSDSELSSLSGNGRFVAFDSRAPNLVKKDDNLRRDVFVRDMRTGKTTRVSVRSNGAQGNDRSGEPDITPDGRFVAFSSHASNLVKGDDNGFADVFVHDRRTRKTRRVSVRSDGDEAHDGDSLSPSISNDGRFVTFRSAAKDLVDGDTNGWLDIFIHDRKTKRTKRIDLGPGGIQGQGGGSNVPVISGNGRFIAYHSFKHNLVPGDAGGHVDIFVWNRKKKTTRMVSVSSSAVQGNGSSSAPAISNDGRFVAFRSDAFNLIGSDGNDAGDVFVHDRKNKKTRRISRSTKGAAGNGNSWEPELSGNGRYVAFHSLAENLVGNDDNGEDDVFVHDRSTKKTRRVSVRKNGRQAKGESTSPAISHDGRFVAFRSSAPKLVKGDSNGSPDVFRRGPLR